MWKRGTEQRMGGWRAQLFSCPISVMTARGRGLIVHSFRRFRFWLFVALGLALVAVGATTAFALSHGKSVNQCSLPVSQRTGGWTCYQPADTRVTP